METITIVLLSAFAYLVIGCRFAKFNQALWNAKISGSGFNPNVNFFGEKTHKICENLMFISLFPVTTFFAAINQLGASPLSFWRRHMCDKKYDRDLTFVTIFWPAKLVLNTATITILLAVIVPAMFVVSIIYSSLTIFSEKPIAEEKPREATAK
ncbi:MAG: hypothetical protein HYW15_03505 [Candidatus Giovannonibacteria bacterium]|nr:MAG: hypothetical protein HYW15_03505 [Candidatus Giovannonibacteria bacterium]